MTLRQAWVRIKALPPSSPLHRAVEQAQEAEEFGQKARTVDDALDMMRRG